MPPAARCIPFLATTNHARAICWSGFISLFAEIMLRRSIESD